MNAVRAASSLGESDEPVCFPGKGTLSTSSAISDGNFLRNTHSTLLAREAEYVRHNFIFSVFEHILQYSVGFLQMSQKTLSSLPSSFHTE